MFWKDDINRELWNVNVDTISDISCKCLLPWIHPGRPDTRQHIILKIWSVIFWHGPAPHDLWWCSDFTSCCVVRDWEPRDHNITCNLLNTNITQTSFTKYRSQQIKESTWPSTFGQKQRDTETGDNFKKVFFWDFRSRYEKYDQIMRRMNRSIIHMK